MKMKIDFAGRLRPEAKVKGADTRERSRPAGNYRVLRGGSWNNNDEINLRSTYRNNDHPTNRNDNNGFRCVVVVSGGKAPLQSVSPRCRAAIGGCPARGKNGSLIRTASPWMKTRHGGR